MKKNYLSILFAVVISSACTYFIVNDQSELHQLKENNNLLTKSLDSCKAVTDSLNNEVFIFKTNQERYEVAINMFKDENPKGYEQLQYIISHKTE